MSPSANLRGGPAAFEGGLLEVGAGAWAWIQPDGALGEANAGLVVGEGASAVIDTTWDRHQARRFLDAAGAHTAAAPIGLAVNTHSDGDHWWGNGELPAGTRILTSRASLEAIGEEPPPSELARSKRLTGVVRRLPGRPGRLGSYLSTRLAPFEFAGNETRAPTESFEDRRTERVGGREIELIEVGPAHTAGDLVVSVPDASVVFAADVLFCSVTPIMWHGPAANWVAATETLLGLGAAVYVPGHGPPGGRAEVEAMREYFRWVSEGAARHHEAGSSAVEATVEMLGTAAAAPFLGWSDPERLLVTMTTELRLRRGEPRLAPNLVNRTRLFDAMAELSRRFG